jgi:hypothetical protein
MSHYTAENLAGIWEEAWTFLKDIDIRYTGHVACILPWYVSVLKIENVSSAS